MGLFEDLTKSWVSSALIGIGAALAVPAIFPALGSGIRPLAKSLVKGGLMVYDSAKELVAEAGEQMNDMVAEVRAEMEEASSGTHAETGNASHEAFHEERKEKTGRDRTKGKG